MTGHQRGHQLVAESPGGDIGESSGSWRAAAASRGCRRPGAVSPCGAALVDQREDLCVGRLHAGGKAALALDPAASRRWSAGNTDSGLSPNASTVGQQVAQAVQAGTPLEAEHGSQHDLQRQPLEPGVQRHRLAGRPGGELAVGQFGHHAGAGAASARRGTRAAAAAAAPGGRPRRAGSPSCARRVGSRIRAPSPGWIASGEAVNSSLMSSGSDRITNGGWNGSWTVTRLP